MLFVHRDSLVLLAPTMSLMNVGQFRGHSCFTIWRVGEGEEGVCVCVRGVVGRETGDGEGGVRVGLATTNF